MDLIPLVHMGATFFMAGLCWFVQLVHYPLFFEIPLKDFPAYERKNFATIFITAPVMGIELLTGLYLLWLKPSTVMELNVLFIFITALSTFIFQVPIHLKLSHAASNELLHKLIKTNWIRTVSWSARMVLLAFWILN